MFGMSSATTHLSSLIEFPIPCSSRELANAYTETGIEIACNVFGNILIENKFKVKTELESKLLNCGIEKSNIK